MHKCLDPSKLPKAPGLRSINRRHVTPGSPLPLIFPGTGSYNPARAVQPTHPATRWKARAFPLFSCLAFVLRAVPKGVLLRPEFERRESQNVSSTTMLLKERKRQQDMSILFMISKKRTNKRAVVRNRIAMRIRAAFELIVVRGADAEVREKVKGDEEGALPEELASPSIARKSKKKQKSSAHQLKLASLVSSAIPSNLVLVSNPEPESNNHLILQDWTYVMSPSLLTYRMPLPDLVKHLRVGLQSIRVQAMKLDALWTLEKKPTSDVPLAVAKHKTNWRHIAGDEDELPTLFYFDEPEKKPTKSTNTQKRPVKLFFPTLSSPRGAQLGDSSVTSRSPPVAQAQPDCSSTMSVESAPPVPLANEPSHQPCTTSDSTGNSRSHPSPSMFRTGAMDRLANMMNRPLVMPGGKQDRRS